MTTLDLRPATVDILLYRGDTTPLTINLKNEAGTGDYVLAGAKEDYTATFTIKTSDGYIVPGTITSTVASVSQVTVSIPSAVTAVLIPEVTYSYDLQVTTTATSAKTSYLRGSISVQGDIS